MKKKSIYKIRVKNYTITYWLYYYYSVRSINSAYMIYLYESIVCVQYLILVKIILNPFYFVHKSRPVLVLPWLT